LTAEWRWNSQGHVEEHQLMRGIEVQTGGLVKQATKLEGRSGDDALLRVSAG
jgi:hypothetical protein